MILPWVYDYNTKRLILQINDELSYEAFAGGSEGYSKTFKGETTTLSVSDWTNEKHWISNNYKDQFGEFVPLKDQYVQVDANSQIELLNGIGPEGDSMDHLQRPSAVMLCKDLAEVFTDNVSTYETPDKGLTIYMRPGIHINETVYSKFGVSPGIDYCREVPQPCHMQPNIQGRRLSSYEELAGAGCSEDIINKCKAGLWDDAPRPDLQKLYVYPK
jgi:hypothetical protein